MITNRDDNQHVAKPENNFTLGKQYKKIGELHKAIACFKQCKPSAECFFLLGKCYQNINNYQDALINFTSALSQKNLKFSHELKIQEQICHTYALYYLKIKDENLLQLFKKAFDNYPHKTGVVGQYLLAQYYFLSNQLQEANIILQKLKQEHPNDSELRVKIAILDFMIHDNLGVEFNEEEIKELINHTKLSNHPNASLLHYIERHYPHLIKLDEIKVSFVGDSINAQISKAEFAFKSNDDFAEENFEKLIERFPNDWVIRRNYAHFLEKNGDVQRAINVLEPYVISARKELDDRKRLNSYRFLANAYLNKNDTIKAKEYIELGLKINPSDERLHSMLGKINPEHSTTSRRNFEISRQDKERTERLHPGPKPQGSKVIIEAEEKSSLISSKKSETISAGKPQVGYKLAENQKDVTFSKKTNNSNAKNAKTKVIDRALLDNPFEIDIGSSNNVIASTNSEVPTIATKPASKVKGKKPQQQPKQRLNKQDKAIVVNQHNIVNNVTNNFNIENNTNTEVPVALNQPENQSSFCQKFGMFAVGVVVTTASIYIASTQLKPNG